MWRIWSRAGGVMDTFAALLLFLFDFEIIVVFWFCLLFWEFLLFGSLVFLLLNWGFPCIVKLYARE